MVDFLDTMKSRRRWKSRLRNSNSSHFHDTTPDTTPLRRPESEKFDAHSFLTRQGGGATARGPARHARRGSPSSKSMTRHGARLLAAPAACCPRTRRRDHGSSGKDGTKEMIERRSARYRVHAPPPTQQSDRRALTILSTRRHEALVVEAGRACRARSRPADIIEHDAVITNIGYAHVEASIAGAVLPKAVLARSAPVRHRSGPDACGRSAPRTQ